MATETYIPTQGSSTNGRASHPVPAAPHSRYYDSLSGTPSDEVVSLEPAVTTVGSTANLSGIADLARSIAELKQEVNRLQNQADRTRLAVINTFAPEPYQLAKPIVVSLYLSEDEVSASFHDANIHTTGANEYEAVENLKSLILDFFDNLVDEGLYNLGPEPLRQRDVLIQYITRMS